MDDVAVAAFDQNVGHRFAQRPALGDGVEVLLALAAGIGEEVPLVEPFGQREHRPRDFDVIIEGEHAG